MLRWIVLFIGNVLALYLVSVLFTGIHIQNLSTLILATIVIAIVNTFIRPIAQILALPLTVITLGLFALVVNTALLGLAAWITPGFTIDGFWTAFWAAIVLSIVSTILNHIFEHPFDKNPA